MIKSNFKMNTRQNKKTNIIISVTIIIVLALAVYANSINGKFIWDDNLLIKDNEYIKSWQNIPKFFTESIMSGIGKESNTYRPIQMITYVIDYSLWGLNVKGYHLTNILLHTLVALCVYWLMNVLYGDNILSLFTSMLFAVHPIHTEAVTYISGRADSLAVLFILLFLILFIRYLRKQNLLLYFIALTSYVLALLSRENSLVLPVLLLFYCYTFKRKLRIKEFLPILIITFGYILLRFTGLKFMLPHISCSTTFLQRLPGFFVAITSYIRLLFLPFNLHMEYGNKLFSFLDLRAIAGALIVFLGFIYAIRKRNTGRIIFFSVLWFFIMILPSSNLYPVNAYMAEHWLYLPSIGMFLILGHGMSLMYRKETFRIYTIILAAVLLLSYSYLTVKQNSYWRDPISFYERTLQYAPDSPRIHYNIGKIHDDRGEKERAIISYKKAIKIYPEHESAYYNLALLYKDLNRNENAIAAFKKAIEINPNHVKAYNNLGNVYSIINSNDDAIAAFKKAIEINPNHAEAYNNLGITYSDLGRYEEAISLYKKAIVINPHNAKAYNNLGNTYYKLGNLEEVKKAWEKALQIDPTLGYIRTNLHLLENTHSPE